MAFDDMPVFMRKQRWIAFDTETTGLWAVSNRLVELAAVRFSLDKGRIDSFQELINPGRKIPDEVIRIHGITDDMVVGSDPAEAVLGRFLDFCTPDDILIAHNARFDISFMACELDRATMTFADNLILDTVDIARRYCPGQPSYSLLSLSRGFGLAQAQEHRALGDAILVQNLFTHMLPQLPAITNLAGLEAAVTTYTMTDGAATNVVLPDGYAALGEAVTEGRRVEMLYASAGQPARVRTVKPLSIHQQNAVIYVNVYCELAGADRTFRLDRIEQFRILDN